MQRTLHLIAAYTFYSALPCGMLHAIAGDDSGDAPYGIEIRRAWTASRVTGSPEPPPPYRTQRVWSELTFENPVELLAMPGTDQMVLLELSGRVYAFPDDTGAAERTLIFDPVAVPAIRQAYGMVFHPDFVSNRYVYLCYVGEDGDPRGTRVSRFTVGGAAPYAIDPESETLIIDWFAGGHNGGCLRFGPDGCLYISTGDGTSPSPPDGKRTGQDISDLLASVLRIDVDRPGGERLYSVPSDNPFLETPDARPEVWAYGFRNPWKMAFDGETGELWLGDVGWEMWEMVYRVERGGNYGWSLVEGPQPVRTEAESGPTPVLPPVISHSHTESRSITGGIVYRGRRLPDLVGAYVYGDYVTGKIWALRADDGELTEVRELVDTTVQVITFGEDRNGELYVVGYDGSLHRLLPNPVTPSNRDFPERLSDTGIFAAVKERTPADGVISYSINAEPWSDGARAERLLAVPGTAKLGVHTENNVQKGILPGAWSYPSDTVFLKTLLLPFASGEGVAWRPVESQMLHRDGDTWRAYAYAWNDEATDAVLVPPEGNSRTYQVADLSMPGQTRQQTWRIAGRTECIVCHTTRAGSIHGFNWEQLDRIHNYDSVEDNQLRTLQHIGLFDPPVDDVAAMPSPWDNGVPLDTRARAYLHVNCAHCHRRGGGGTARFEVRYELTLPQTALVGERPTQGAFGIPAAEVVAAGDPAHSVLLYRMAKLGRGRMPHAGSAVVDEEGLGLIREWIAQLPSIEGDAHIDRPLEAEQSAAIAKLADETGDATTLIEQLLGNTSGAMRLVFAVDDGLLDPDVAAEVIARGTAHPRAEIRDLFERFVPEEERTPRLGTMIRTAELLSRPGDEERGEELFFNTAGVQCKTCHKIGETGGEVGPELTRIGEKLNRAQLLESILEPSKKIDPKFVPYLLETKAGLVHNGLLVSRTDSEVVLRNAQDKLETIKTSDIELITPQQKSLMPDLLLRDLTEQQVADLLEYLTRRR